MKTISAWIQKRALRTAFLGLNLVVAVSSMAQVAVPTIRFNATGLTVYEGTANQAVDTWLYITNGFTGPLTVYYSLSGAASNGVDYVTLPGSVEIPAGTNRVAIRVEAMDDSLAEPTENVIITLQSNANYGIEPNSLTASSIAIRDNDNLAPAISWVSPTNQSVIAGPTNILLRALASDSDGWLARVEFFKNGASIGYVLGQDSNALYSFAWTNVEPGTYSLTVRATDNFETRSTSAPVSITITSGKPTVNVYAADEAAYEGGSPATNRAMFRIARTGNTSSNLTVSFKLLGSAVNGVDYTNVSSLVTIPAGSSNAFVVISPIDDSLVEGTESVTLQLSNNIAYPYLVGTNASKSVSIYDNDSELINVRPFVNILQPTNGATFAGPTNLLVKAQATDSDGTLQLIDFYAGTNYLGRRFAPSNSSTFTAELVWSNAPAGTYALKAIAIDNRQSYGTSAPVNITITTQTNTEKPTVNIYVTDEAAYEGGSPATNTATFRIARTGNTSSSLTVSFQLSGSAVNGVDYTNVSSLVTIPAGSSNAFVVISPIDDSLVEGTESVTLQLSNNVAYPYLVGTNASKSISIYDNDSSSINHPPLATIIQPTNGASFAGPTNLLVKAQGIDTDGTLQLIDFYAGTNYLGRRFAPSNSASFTAELVWSNAPAGTYALKAIAIDNRQDYGTSAPVNITITAQTNTVKPTLWVFAADSSAKEGDGTGELVIKRFGASISNSLTVTFSLSGTAQNGVDYSNLATTVTIPAGSSNASVVVQPIDDALVEETETVVLTLSSNVAYNLGGSPISGTVSIYDNDFVRTNIPPSVSIDTPTNGATFTGPTNITIYASAYDGTNGWIDTVQFFEGTNSLGIVTNCPVCAYIQNPFHVFWENIQPGNYTVTAKATDNEGAVTVSEPVHITVNLKPADPQPQPIVTLSVVDAEAAEGPGANAGAANNTATFTIRRTENTNVEITVYYDILGTASNGVDYVTIPGSVTMRRGVAATNIVIRPIDDTVREVTETVTLRFSSMACIAVYPPPPECYLVGSPSVATASILDNDSVSNVPPAVHMVTPANGAIFNAPAMISMKAEASDSDGTVTKVEFFSGDTLLGVSSAAPYVTTWSNVVAGTYMLSAKATDNSGATRWSEPVTITVRYAEEASFVSRKLPVWYVPGVTLTVQLRAEPKTNLTSYVVEDLPPSGWTVGAVSSNGVFNSGTGRVRFVINEGGPRTLTYEVTPRADSRGEKQFSGTVGANGMIAPILGGKFIAQAPAHPADRSPTNFVMSSLELSNYVHAWKYSQRWPLAPNPIPVSYVARAGYLLAHGGSYTISAQSPTPFPPLLWVSSNTVSYAFEPVGFSANEIPWTTNHMGTAVSSMATNYSIGVPLTVSMTVTPSSGVAAYAVEDRPPKGWIVTNMSEGGVFCPETGKIRWGVFTDGVGRILSYTVIPVAANAPRTAEFAGVASFDGVNVPIIGGRKTIRMISVSPNAVLDTVKLLVDGNRLWNFKGTPGVCYTLEGSTNLVDWEPVVELLNNDGALQFIDLTTNQAGRFYRAMPK